MSDKKIDYIQNKVDTMSDTIANINKDMAVQKATFEAHLQQEATKTEELKRMNDILQENTESLKEHMQQTMLLKQLVVDMDVRLSPIEIEFIQKSAVKKWVVARVKFLAKLGAAVAGVTAIWVYVKPIIEHLLSK